MKTGYTKRFQRLFLFAMAIALVAGQSSGFAQENTIEEVGDFYNRVNEIKIDLKFDSPLVLTEFLELVQTQTPFPLNTVIQRGAENVMIPPMSLQQVSVKSVFDAVYQATEYELEWDFEGDGEIISVRRNPDYDGEPGRPLMVINVSRILQGRNLETLMSAIELGLQMQNDGKNQNEKVNLKLHEQTRLLFVKGTDAELDVVYQIVEQLGGSPYPYDDEDDEDDDDDDDDDDDKGANKGNASRGGVFGGGRFGG